MHSLWNEGWKRSGVKMLAVREEVGEWEKCRIGRKLQIIVNRLRIGPTNLTQSYRMKTEEETPPPECLICQKQTLTVKHIFMECRKLARIREEILGKSVPNVKRSTGRWKDRDSTVYIYEQN